MISYVLFIILIHSLKNYMYLPVCVCHGLHMDSRGQFSGSVFSFYHTGPGDRTQIARLSHLTSTPHPFLKMDFLSGF